MFQIFIYGSNTPVGPVFFDQQNAERLARQVSDRFVLTLVVKRINGMYSELETVSTFSPFTPKKVA